MGVTGGLDCVHLMYPDLHGASAVIAAGSRDSYVYLWRRRSDRGEEGGGRTMRTFTGTVLRGHKVGLASSCHNLPRHSSSLHNRMTATIII